MTYRDINTIYAEIAQLEAENAELKADAERLDWMFKQGDELALGILIDQPGDGDHYCSGLATYGTGKNYREAIDKAMKEETK